MASPSVSTPVPTSQLSTPDQTDGDGAAGPLENYANSVSPSTSPKGTARARRYARRALLWDVSSQVRVRKCGKVTRSATGHVGVRYGANGAGFSGLCTCGSIWACPVCNAKVMAHRALELGCAVAAWQAKGGAMLFTTLTVRHNRSQPLAQVWQTVTEAWRSVVAGKAWVSMRARLGVAGYVRAVEVTHGRNGWHVHIHALVLVQGAVTTGDVAHFEGWIVDRWSRAVVRRGAAAPLARAQDVRLVRDVADGDLAAYVTKQTDLALELTQSQSKRARYAHSTVPVWDLLTRVERDGDLDALDLWHEWERGSKGHMQLTWSKGLRAMLALGVERTDEEVAEQEAGDFDLLLITSEGWSSLVGRPHLIPEVLVAAENSGPALRAFLREHAVEYVETLENA